MESIQATHRNFRPFAKSIFQWVIVAQAVLAACFAQQAVAQPDPDRGVKYCYAAQVMSGMTMVYKIVPGWGEDLTQAKANARDNAARCGTPFDFGGYPEACPLVELPACAKTLMSSADLKIRSVDQASLVEAAWKVEGTLTYCDGSTGFQLETSGSTLCEAIQRARTALCGIKDRFKRACLTFRIVAKPCQNVCHSCQSCHP